MRSALLALWLCGCAGPPTSPARATAPTAPSAPIAPPPVASAAPTAPAPEDEEADVSGDVERHPCLRAKAKPGGVVPVELFPVWRAEDLNLSAPCRAPDEPGNVCTWDPSPSRELLGFDAHGHAAVVAAPDIATAGDDCDETFGEIFDLARSKPVSRARLFKDGPCAGSEAAFKRFAARAAAQGFSMPRFLVVRTAMKEVGATGYRPVALLGGPLCGWMLRVEADPPAKRLPVALVAPDNDKSFALGDFPLENVCLAQDDKGACTDPGAFAYPSIREVALTPGRARLYVGIRVTPGGHNLPLRSHHATFALPPGVL